MASGRLADYLGVGDEADIPVSLDLSAGAVGFFYAKDSNKLFAWDGVQWVLVLAGGAPAADDVTYDNVSSGLSATDVQGAIDELAGLIGVGALGYDIVTEGSAFTATPGDHDGLLRYVRAGGDVTFSDTEAYTAGMVFNIRPTAAIELIEDNVTLTPTYGGTLQLEAQMGVQVVFTSATTADVNGLTVAAP